MFPYQSCLQPLFCTLRLRHAPLLLAAGLYFLTKQEPALTAYMPTDELAAVGGVVILFGITICSLCAFLSVNRFLRMRNNDLYFI